MGEDTKRSDRKIILQPSLSSSIDAPSRGKTSNTKWINRT